MIAILHNIRSIHNVGSMFRTADGAGVEKIFLVGYTPSPLDEFGRYRKDFSKVSLGAEKTILWEKINSFSVLTKKLRKDGFKIVAVEQSKKSIPYHKVRGIRRTSHSTQVWRAGMNSKFRVAFIFGNEVRGLPASALREANQVIEIPMFGKKESLNVAVAFGIIIYHWALVLKQRI